MGFSMVPLAPPTLSPLCINKFEPESIYEFIMASYYSRASISFLVISLALWTVFGW